MRMLNSNLDLNVTYVVTVDFQAVAEAVELLGGIDEELSEEEIIHLNNYCKETAEVTGMDYEPLEEVAGVHHLNGVQTVAYAGSVIQWAMISAGQPARESYLQDCGEGQECGCGYPDQDS